MAEKEGISVEEGRPITPEADKRYREYEVACRPEHSIPSQSTNATTTTAATGTMMANYLAA